MCDYEMFRMCHAGTHVSQRISTDTSTHTTISQSTKIIKWCLRSAASRTGREEDEIYFPFIVIAGSRVISL